jgi:hypothetical protein
MRAEEALVATRADELRAATSTRAAIRTCVEDLITNDRGAAVANGASPTPIQPASTPTR